jgi:uncharacterized protein
LFSLAVTAWSDRKYGEAVGLFRRCVECDSGHAGAHFYLRVAYYRGIGVPEDSVQAAFCWRRAAEEGHAQAQNNLAALCEEAGLAENYREAAFWYLKAAEQGYATAQFNLGGMFRLGQGVRQNYADAASWYRKAAEQGHAGAQYNLGAMCTLGQGMRRDFTEAAEWFRRAAAQGDELAQEAFQTLTAEPQGHNTHT